MGRTLSVLKRDNPKLLKIMISLFMIFYSLPTLAQVTLLRGGVTTGTQDLEMPTDVILYLIMNVTDAEYTDEVQMLVNGQGPINLFRGANSSGADISKEYIIELNSTQRGYFVQGTNTLDFTLNASDMKFDGVVIRSVTLVDSVETKKYLEIEPSIDEPISDNRKRALEIYKRIAGVRTPIDNPILVEMEAEIDRGDLKAAAQIAATEPSFLNLVVRDFAARMSTREQSINEPLNDFTSTFIGVTRDEIDARQLLMGDLYYMAIGAPIVKEHVTSNDHYVQLQTRNYNLASVLEKVDNQIIRTSSGATASNPDAAGVITSRAFMGAHAIDGTNRRLVEYTFKQFTCSDMEEWADATGTEVRIGRDIDRFPGGESSKFLTTCKACHSTMDGFRGAFAKYDFDDGIIKHASFFGDGNGIGSMDLSRGRNGNGRISVAEKMNANGSTFSSGFFTEDDSWINNAISPSNKARFGWRGIASSGNGVKQMATAVANSKAFSKCMTKKVYREVCRRSVANFETGMVDSVAAAFEASGYNLKDLFTTIAVRPECIGAR